MLRARRRGRARSAPLARCRGSGRRRHHGGNRRAAVGSGSRGLPRAEAGGLGAPRPTRIPVSPPSAPAGGEPASCLSSSLAAARPDIIGCAVMAVRGLLLPGSPLCRGSRRGAPPGNTPGAAGCRHQRAGAWPAQVAGVGAAGRGWEPAGATAAAFPGVLALPRYSLHRRGDRLRLCQERGETVVGTGWCKPEGGNDPPGAPRWVRPVRPGGGTQRHRLRGSLVPSAAVPRAGPPACRDRAGREAAGTWPDPRQKGSAASAGGWAGEEGRAQVPCWGQPPGPAGAGGCPVRSPCWVTQRPALAGQGHSDGRGRAAIGVAGGAGTG